MHSSSFLQEQDLKKKNGQKHRSEKKIMVIFAFLSH
jgi:hypothetical protein